MDKEKLYSKYRLTQWATFRQGDEVLNQFIDDIGINVFINFDTQEFWMEYMIPRSIFSVKCPKCSPISNEEHFDKMYSKFKNCIFQYAIH